MEIDSKAQDRQEREKAKQEARKARNEAQAIEEQAIWQEIGEQSKQAAIIYKAKRAARISYSQELAIEICDRLSNGESLQSICKEPGMPAPSAIYVWIAQEPFFKDIYTRAREHAAHTLFDQCIDIADDSADDILPDGSPNNAKIQRAKLQIDTRMRVAGKLAPRVYGERIEQLNQTVNVTNNSLTIDGASLGADQRNALRAMLLQAQAKTIDN